MPKHRVSRHEVIQPTDPTYRLIPLTKGQNAIVDTADYEWLNQWNWYATWNAHTRSFYAARSSEKDGDGKQYTVRMAREILKCGSAEQADHRNHNTLDNRRANLRDATQSQNVQNRRMRHSNISGYVGVSWHPLMKKWLGRIESDGNEICLGYFSSPERAASAYNEAAKLYHGEFARLNQINDSPRS